MSLEVATGRTIAYIDEGDSDWTPVVFVGGAGTSVRVFRLLEFARSLREDLELRVIAVERNGFGQTAFDGSLGYADYAADVEALLDHLGVEEFIGFAISGGGPYLTEIVSRNAARVLSVHLASALSQTPPDASICAIDDPETLRFFTEQPMVWFSFPPESPVQIIPGFQDSAFEDAARTFFVGGQTGDPSALFHEFQLYCTVPLADVSDVQAPVFIYHGIADTTVPLDPHVPYWQTNYSNVERTRLYEGEGHDVQYRHLDQILVDMAGMANKLVVCRNGNTKLIMESKAEQLVAEGRATLGICAWTQPGAGDDDDDDD
jgi:pimeloyl-ACP methyl ester carboxylesterase